MYLVIKDTIGTSMLKNRRLQMGISLFDIFETVVKRKMKEKRKGYLSDEKRSRITAQGYYL